MMVEMIVAVVQVQGSGTLAGPKGQVRGSRSGVGGVKPCLVSNKTPDTDSP